MIDFAPGEVTTDVRIYKVAKIPSTVRGKPAKYRLRWMTAGVLPPHTKNFERKGLADTRRSELVAAQSKGVLFHIETGLPVTELAALKAAEDAKAAAEAAANAPTWFSHASRYALQRWPAASEGQRRSIADSLATVTPAFLLPGSTSPANLRRALYGWAYVPGLRYDLAAERPVGEPPPERPAPEDLAETLNWLTQNTRMIADFTDTDVARAGLAALAVTLGGKAAAANTQARKRAVYYGCLRLAVELELLDSHPLDRISWTAPKAANQVDRRSVVNRAQTRALLAAVDEIEPRLTAWFGLMRDAALRPEECQEVRIDDLELPDESDPAGWGTLTVSIANPDRAGQWYDGGQREAREQLKHRGKGDSRTVPLRPSLVRLIRSHLAEFGTAPDGRLFRAAMGGPVKTSRYGQVWRDARKKALTPAQVRSPLGATPYDLRHACLSEWLGSVTPQQAATWAGNSPGVLLKTYAKLMDGGEAAAIRRLAAATADEDEDQGEITDVVST